MALTNRKITGWTQPVSDLDDKPTISAKQLKAAFDSNTNQLRPAINGMIDDLTGTGGADEIGADVTGVQGTTVQEILDSFYAMIQNCFDKTAIKGFLDEKADKTTTDKLVKSIAFNAKTGVFTIKTDDNTTSTIDTVLEKVPISCKLEGQDFVLTLEDGTEQRVSLSAFLTPTEFTDSATIDFSVSGEAVTAGIKAGSVTLAMLESSLKSTLEGSNTSAATSASQAAASAQNAAASAAAAKTSEETVSQMAEGVLEASDTVEKQEASAKNSAAAAAQSASSASTDAADVKVRLKAMGVHVGADTPPNDEKMWLVPVESTRVMSPVEKTEDMTQPVGMDDSGKLFTAPGGGSGASSGLPAVSTGDNGKFLRVVDGAWAAAAISSAGGVSF